MKRQQVYVDTSVIGGVFDPEFKEWSIRLFNEFVKGIKVLVLSDLTLEELEEAPMDVRDVIDRVPSENVRYVLLNEEGRNLASKYIMEGVVTAKYLLDAQHIAIATIERVSVVVSWNFRHIVNLNKIRLYNAVNVKNGYDQVEIRSPREVLDVA